MQVSKLENELLRVSAECHRVHQAAEQSKAKYQEELADVWDLVEKLLAEPPKGIVRGGIR